MLSEAAKEHLIGITKWIRGFSGGEIPEHMLDPKVCIADGIESMSRSGRPWFRDIADDFANNREEAERFVAGLMGLT